SGSPRRPSFAPSSTTTSAGFTSASSFGSRASPPAVVSPLMLALTIGRGSPAAFRRCSRRCTQPLSGAMRCADDSESPSTRTGAFTAGFAAAAGATTAASNDNDDNKAARNFFDMKDDIGIAIGADKVSKAVDGPDGRL